MGAAHIAVRLGREGMRDSLAAFGLGERTGMGLPGEVRGQLPFPGSDFALATQSFGYNLTATPLQLTNAMAALANGGVLLRPSIVRRVVDVATGEVLDEARPETIRRAVSEATAATLRRWLAGVVEDPKGTGRRARPDGWRVAGKTGTARKVDPVGGGYAADRHLSSFVGFAPAESPRIVVGVFIDEPKGDLYGGDIAAPAFREIVEYALARMGVPRDAPLAAPAVALAPVAADAEEAPAAALDLADGAIDSAAGRPDDGPGTRRPARPRRDPAARARGPRAGADGAGRVVSQSPVPGKVVDRGTRVRMRLAPAG